MESEDHNLSACDRFCGAFASYDEERILLLRKQNIPFDGSTRTSSVRIPSVTRKFSTIKLRPLNILPVSSVNHYDNTNSYVFHNNLRVRYSPLNSYILRKCTYPFATCVMYPSISKCNAKR